MILTRAWLTRFQGAHAQIGFGIGTPSTAYNRLMPGGSIVVINHRMHEDDLCGALLAQQAAGGDTWEVVELPAITEDGSALWPDAYPIEALERIRKNSQARFWSALYMQRPSPDEGDYFKVDWLKPYDKAPSLNTLRVYGGSDYATTSDGGDFTRFTPSSRT